jgi:hypothetical protein
MKQSRLLRSITTALIAGVIGLPAWGQTKDAPKKEEKAGGQPSESEMMAMMTELAKPGENHKLLGQLVGSWTYTVKMWMNPDPKSPPMESTGKAVFRDTMGGRYVVGEHTGKMQMPGPDGKMTDTEFKGMGIDAYDNAKKKFVASWIDNMGTGILLMEGTYDPATRTFTYRGEEEMMPGMKTKFRVVVKVEDKDHRQFEWFEDRGGTEFKMMEIKYERKT